MKNGIRTLWYQKICRKTAQGLLIVALQKWKIYLGLLMIWMTYLPFSPFLNLLFCFLFSLASSIFTLWCGLNALWWFYCMVYISANLSHFLKYYNNFLYKTHTPQFSVAPILRGNWTHQHFFCSSFTIILYIK